jgi:monoamine oxidase
MAMAWAIEQMEQELQQELTKPQSAVMQAAMRLGAEDIVKVAKDAFVMFPDDETAAMDWMRANMVRGADTPAWVEEIYRQAYRDLKQPEDRI